MDIGHALAVISGGASGLGLATAEAVIAAGGKAVLLDVQDEPGRAAAARLGARAHYIHADVTSEADIDAAVAEAVKFMGGINFVVNCAGVVAPGRAVGRDGALPGATFSRVIAINLTGTFLLNKATAVVMQHNTPNAGGERGVIVQTASVAAFDGQIGQPAYAASKAGVVGMTLPLAREFARFGVRVVTVAPGLFETPMMSSLPEEAQKSLGAMTPFPPRLGYPSEYAQLALAIYGNPMLNGETIRLDGAVRLAPK